MQSSKLLKHMKKLHARGKESSPDLLEMQGLQADVKLSYIDVKLKELHPVLRLDDHLAMLANENRLDILCGGHADFFGAINTFWTRYAEEDGELVRKLKSEKGDLSACVPMCMYGDEGQSHKKSQFMVFATEPVLGAATSFTHAKVGHRQDLRVNMVGVSCVTRFLFSVMKATLYNRSPCVFEALVEQYSKHCEELFASGVRLWHAGMNRYITIFPTFLFAKADWPWHKKWGNLVRTHHQSISQPGRGKGICHLCMAGSPAYSDWGRIAGSWLCEESLERPSPPWTREPRLVALCQSSSLWSKTWWFRPDLFHTLHKGVCAELAGSAIVSFQH